MTKIIAASVVRECSRARTVDSDEPSSVTLLPIMKRKPLVWFVDDLPSNLDTFRRRHSEIFTIRTFATPAEVLDALSVEKPDALLCDVFFYETAEIAADMEKRVQEKAGELREFGTSIGANKSSNQSGVQL